MNIETKVKILKKIQPTCEDIGFFIGAMLGYMSFEGGGKGIEIVRKRFDNYYTKLYGKQLEIKYNL